MALFYVPVIMAVEADSYEDAQNSVDDWAESVDMKDGVPEGTEEIDTTPTIEYSDDGKRLVYLPENDEAAPASLDDVSSVENGADDFNDGDPEEL